MTESEMSLSEFNNVACKKSDKAVVINNINETLKERARIAKEERIIEDLEWYKEKHKNIINYLDFTLDLHGFDDYAFHCGTLVEKLNENIEKISSLSNCKLRVLKNILEYYDEIADVSNKDKACLIYQLYNDDTKYKVKILDIELQKEVTINNRTVAAEYYWIDNILELILHFITLKSFKKRLLEENGCVLEYEMHRYRDIILYYNKQGKYIIEKL